MLLSHMTSLASPAPRISFSLSSESTGVRFYGSYKAYNALLQIIGAHPNVLTPICLFLEKFKGKVYLIGPAAELTEERLIKITDAFSKNLTQEKGKKGSCLVGSIYTDSNINLIYLKSQPLS